MCREGPVKMEAEAGGCCRHSQGNQKPSEAERGRGGAPRPLESVERARPCLDLSLDFWFQNWEKVSFCHVKLPGNEGTVLSGSCPFFSIVQSHSPTKSWAQKSCPSSNFCCTHIQHLASFCNSSSIFLSEKCLSPLGTVWWNSLSDCLNLY